MRNTTSSHQDTASKKSFSLSEAATATGKSRVTIRRYLDAERFPNAYRDTSTRRRPLPWRIPRSDLLAAGLIISEPEKGPPSEPSESAGTGSIADASSGASTHKAIAEERLRTIEVLDRTVTRLSEVIEHLTTDRPNPGGEAHRSEPPDAHRGSESSSQQYKSPEPERP